MRQRSTSFASLGLGLLGLAALSLGTGCDSCPDLSYKSYEIDVIGADPTELIMDVTLQGETQPVCDAIAASENCNAPAGVYDFTFTYQGGSIGGVTDVCSLGEQTGCAAEDSEARGPWAIIQVLRDSNGWTITVEQQGVCP